MDEVLSLGYNEVSGLTIAQRAGYTLALAHLRGYALPVDRLPCLLLGGPEPAGVVREAISGQSRIILRDGLACLRGSEGLLHATQERLSSHPGLEGSFARLARSYARELVGALPTVECVAVAGSLSSGGLCSGDDIDFNLFVRDGSKFLSYLASLMLAGRYGLGAARGGNGNGSLGGAGAAAASHPMPLPLITKRICINVIWERAEARPFARRDAALAFEILNSRPIHNSRYFDEVVARNRWLLSYFPQIAARHPAEELAPPGNGRLVSGVLGGLARAGLGEGLSRRAVGMLHSLVAGYREAYPESRACARRKELLKHPYGLLELPGTPWRGREA